MADEKKPEPAVGEIKESDYQLWRHHPVTKMMLRYFEDYGAVLERDHLARWRAGALNPDTEAEAKGRCATLTELATLPFSAIVAFYDEPEQEAQEADGPE